MNPVADGHGTEAEDVVWMRLGAVLDAVARREAARLSHRIGMSADRVAEVELAVTEAATNLRKYAKDGSLALRIVRMPGRAAVELLSLDTGPGIPDLSAALADGVSSRGTLGIGLGSIARCADTFDVYSVPGVGTALLARFWSVRAGGALVDVEPSAAGLTRPISGETVCGDSWAARTDERPDGVVVTSMMCDGLGHGPLAALAGERARAAFRTNAHRSPELIIRALHDELRGTRGAAVAVARADYARGTVEHCGVGNISGCVVIGDKRSALLSVPGIVGHQMPALKTHQVPLERSGVLVLHSDGLSDRWSPASFPGLFRRRPALIAAQILGQAGVRRDDAGIVVVKAADS